MKEFCNSVIIYPLSGVLSLEGGALTLKPGATVCRFLSDDFDLSPKRDGTEAGALYVLDKDIVIDKANRAEAAYFMVGRSVIVELSFTDDHSPVYLGTVQLPAKASITTHPVKDTLHIKSRSFLSPL
jgi:hypothetical protein